MLCDAVYTYTGLHVTWTFSHLSHIMDSFSLICMQESGLLLLSSVFMSHCMYGSQICVAYARCGSIVATNCKLNWRVVDRVLNGQGSFESHEV